MSEASVVITLVNGEVRVVGNGDQATQLGLIETARAVYRTKVISEFKDVQPKAETKEDLKNDPPIARED